MRMKLMSKMITGGMLGATAGMYFYSKMSPRQRRKLLRRGNKMVKNTSCMLDMMSKVNFLR
ncbi:hypothetical protein IZY60_14825 [Lutibacter sp. B2]|nr:hypothetical protein [Lutibacter sp. B2]